MISQLPIKRDIYNNMGYKEIVEKYFSEYLEDLSSLDEQDKASIWGSSNWDKYFNRIVEHTNLLNETIRLQYLGLHSRAYNKLKGLLFGECEIISFLKPKNTLLGASYYRMRIFNDRRNVSYKDMFHIPLDKRGIVKTQRYSMPGYPCLYLGKSVYTCWEEMGRPEFSTCMVSRFEQNSFLSFIDVTKPSSESFNNNYISGLTLMKYPMVIACMVQVLDYNDTYKPEYIIPQLLMEYVIECRETDKNEKKITCELSGIYYTSVHKSKSFNFEGEILNNLAIPVFDPLANTKYCPVLCSTFSLTEPTCEEYERIKISGRGGIMLSDAKSEYEISSFYLVEKALKSSTQMCKMNTEG